MSTFLVDPNASQNDIVGALNYALANLGAGTTGNSTAGVTQIVAGTNISISPNSGNGIVTISASVSGNVTLSSNIVVANSATSGAGAGFVTNVLNSGLSSPSVLSYLYPYLNVKYSNSPTGAGMVSNPYGQSYYGIHNNETNTVDTNPVDYSWYLVTGGFGTNKLLWYTTNGGGQANFIPSIAQPSIYYSPVQDDIPILIQTLSNNAVATTNIQAAAVTGYNVAANTITSYNISANTITAYNIAANTITGNLIAANTIQGNSIVAGSITATQLQANLLTVGNIVSTNGTIEVPTGAGYWLDYTNGNVYFGGNTQIGTNLIVGNNAVIGGNLSIGGLVTGGNLNSNTVTTTTLVVNAVSLGNGVSTSTAQNFRPTVYFQTFYYDNCQPTFTTQYPGENVYINGVTSIQYLYSGSPGIYQITSNLLRKTANAANSTGTVLSASYFSYFAPSAGGSIYYFTFNPSFTYLDIPNTGGTGSYQYYMSVTMTSPSNFANIQAAGFLQGSIICQGLKR